MSWIPDFLLATPVTLNRMRTVNFDGSRALTSSADLRGRLVPKTDCAIQVGNDLVQYNYVLYLADDVDVQTDDRVVIGAKETVVKALYKPQRPDGQTDHTAVYLL